MRVDLNDIEFAIEFVSSDYSFDNHAYINSETGVIYYAGDVVDEELPEDIDDNKYISIPSKRDLDLGKRVALEFAAEEIPDEFNKVYSIFSQRGAYSRFKSLLHSLVCTDKWYQYESKAMKDAVIEWCKENSIPVKTT